MNRAAAHPGFDKPFQPPGGMMVWVFIFMELFAFGLAFIVFSALRGQSLAVFESSQAELSQALGLINTLVLVTSGYCVVLANGNYDRGNDRDRQRLLAHVRPDLGAPLSHLVLDLSAA